jgi:hypothetical protein
VTAMLEHGAISNDRLYVVHARFGRTASRTCWRTAFMVVPTIHSCGHGTEPIGRPIMAPRGVIVAGELVPRITVRTRRMRHSRLAEDLSARRIGVRVDATVIVRPRVALITEVLRTGVVVGTARRRPGHAQARLASVGIGALVAVRASGPIGLGRVRAASGVARVVRALIGVDGAASSLGLVLANPVARARLGAAANVVRAFSGDAGFLATCSKDAGIRNAGTLVAVVARRPIGVGARAVGKIRAGRTAAAHKLAGCAIGARLAAVGTTTAGGGGRTNPAVYVVAADQGAIINCRSTRGIGLRH